MKTIAQCGECMTEVIVDGNLTEAEQQIVIADDHACFVNDVFGVRGGDR